MSPRARSGSRGYSWGTPHEHLGKATDLMIRAGALMEQAYREMAKGVKGARSRGMSNKVKANLAKFEKNIADVVEETIDITDALEDEDYRIRNEE